LEDRIVVSIIIPAYNYEKYLKEAIDSALNQTVRCEIIVVNDGSTDGTEEIAKSYGDKIVYLYKDNNGLSAARNSGIKIAKGEYILCLDADDAIDPTFVEKTMAKMDKDIGIVRTGYKEFGEMHREFMNTNGVTFGSLRKSNSIPATALFKRVAWEEVGGYDENMKEGYEDWEFWLRLVKHGYSVDMVEEFLLNYRKHGISMIDEANDKYQKLVKYIYEKHPTKKKILFLEDIIQHEMGGTTYYRMAVPARELENLGYEIMFSAELLLVDKDGGNPRIIIDDLEWADIVVFPRYFQFSPNVVVQVMWECKKMGKKIVYETDDCLYHIPEHNITAGVLNCISSQEMIKFLEENADIKTVTTRKLKELISHGKDNVYICPNSIDMSMWEGLDNKKTGKLVVGWAGGSSHIRDLEMIVPVLQKLKKKYQFEIKLLGFDPKFAKNKLYYKHVKWVKVLEYPRMLAEAGLDIGIAPLVDDEFNQYKSNIKWLEYGMLGVPIVASQNPTYEDIKDGEDGFLATTLAEWEEKLEKLIIDEGLRRRMGQKAHDRIVKEYDIKKTVHTWADAYESMYE
jgi:glycosyltransferase involved in cell wall biosynthesis